ncbi:MAG TPA: hypothetical protein VFG56_00930 [Candidatus Saccharimonadales bacterium]|nr:hypothetical protein [Candidatus Saccharimonadales bacterium]
MREIGFGLMKLDLGQLIIALIVAWLGIWLLQGGRSSTVKAIIGAFLAGLGLFAALMSIYVVDYRWVNTLLAIVVLIAIGVALFKAAGIATTAIGLVLILVGLGAIDQLSLFGDIHLNGALKDTFDQAHRMWNRAVS